MRYNNFFTLLVLAIASFGLCSHEAISQDKLSFQDELNERLGDDEMVDEPVVLTGSFKLTEGTRKGVISLRAEIADHWHIYSISQAKGGPLPSRIYVEESEAYKVTGDFEPDADPILEKNDPIFNIPVEKHKGEVTWTAPVELADGVDPNNVEMSLRYRGQTCVDTGLCDQISEQVDITFVGYEAAPVAASKFKPQFSHLLLYGKVRRLAGPGVIKPGDRIDVNVTAEPTDHFHIYAQEERPSDELTSTPTLFAMTKQNGWSVNGPTTTDDVIEIKEPDFSMRYHEDPVTWKFSILVPVDAEEKTYSFSGIMGFQTCTQQCDRPDAARFNFEIPVGQELDSLPVSFISDTSYNEVKTTLAALVSHAADEVIPQPPSAPSNYTHEVVKDTEEQIAEMAKLYDAEEKIKYLTYSDMDANPIGSGGTSSSNQTTFWTALLGTFLGGIILNLMPCVFPVLGLKVMGFVEQAGSDPKKIRMHGLAFAGGLVVSMWILGSIILSIKLVLGQDINWGAQMGNPYFVVSMIVLLFVLGLNMAGVFEIGTSMTRVGGAQKQKGLAGSFLSGVLTTLIATPCSGPFLGAAMSYTLAQPALTAMFLFTVFALGISTPYVLLSFFPALINKLPRPGAWMETFKVTMAFAMFAVVAFFMQAFGGQTGVSGLSWLAMALVVIGLAAFFYGTWSLPHIKPTKRVWMGFVVPCIIALIGGWMCFDAASQRAVAASSHSAGGLAWQDWNPGKIEYMLAKNKRIIWVDYTADW